MTDRVSDRPGSWEAIASKNEIANDNITEESFEDNRGNEKPNESYPSAREVIEDKIVDVQGIDVAQDVEEIPTKNSVQAKTDEIKDIIDDDIVNKDLKMANEAKFKEEISARAFDPGDFEHKWKMEKSQFRNIKFSQV